MGDERERLPEGRFEETHERDWTFPSAEGQVDESVPEASALGPEPDVAGPGKPLAPHGTAPAEAAAQPDPSAPVIDATGEQALGDTPTPETGPTAASEGMAEIGAATTQIDGPPAQLANAAPVAATPEVASSAEPREQVVASANVAPPVAPPTSAPQSRSIPSPSEAVSSDGAPDGAGADAVEAGGALEELTLPPSVAALEPLPVGAIPDPGGLVRVERLEERRGRVNRYLATRTSPGGDPAPVELLEGPIDQPELRREAEVLSQVSYAMLPKLHATWEGEGRRYLVLDRTEGPTLADALEAGMGTEQVVSVALQLAQALRRLHAAGWALAGLSPDGVTLGEPIRLARLGAAVRIGEAPTHALHVPGYSAPELAFGGAVTGKEDVYAIGALLYRALAGQPLPEQGPELSALATLTPTPGAPQLLAAALAPAPERSDLQEFYARLLAFKRRIALAPLALRVASGTSVGLNQTRPANEDACGYLTWSTAYEGRVAYDAVLCAIDGMGGMDAGEVASTAALRAVLHGAASYSLGKIDGAHGTDRETDEGAAGNDGATMPPTLDPKSLVRAAAEATYVAARGRQVGATITCALIEDGTLTLGHVGDTRAYLFRDGVLTQLTRDHSLVAAMVASGMITKQEARGHPEQNKVLRSLGGQRTLPDDHIDGLEVAYGESTLRLREGDQLLLCSDGVWGVLDDDALLGILTESPDGEAAVRMAIRRVLEGGAPDNAAIIVARCVVMPAS